MKALVFVFLSLFSPLAFSFEIGICEDALGNAIDCGTDSTTNGSSSIPGYQAVYDPVTGITKLEKIDGTVNTPGVWNPSTFSCTNFVLPKVDAAGDIVCPAQSEVKTPDSEVTPNPSVDDKACDPTKPIDPLNPDSGCASEQTAKKTNDLISESNSKLGSIASSNATNSGILGSILDTLKGISSQGAVASDSGTGSDTGSGTGTGSGSGSGSGTDNDVTEIVDKDVIFNKPISISSSSCIAAERISVLGKNYEISYQPVCDLLSSMKGIVVAFGAFSALMIVVTAL